jgi:hypothetical protein
MPRRALELIEYPPVAAADPPEEAPPREVRHGDRWTTRNDGAAATCLTVEIGAPRGVVGPAIVNLETGRRVRLMSALSPSEMARLWCDPDGSVRAEIEKVDGTVRPVSAADLVIDGEDVLILPRGASEWAYLDCHTARYNYDYFDGAHFAGGRCRERGVFDVSRFAAPAPEREASVFASRVAGPVGRLRFRWQRYQPGAFRVNLPLDLPERLGARFNYARFGRADGPECYEQVTVEPRPHVNPADDFDHLVGRLVKEPSTLVEASWVGRVPIGFTSMAVPFRGPRVRKLGGGRDGEPARLYLHEPQVSGYVELVAREPGDWGNAIAVTARKAGPARYDVTIGFAGARFEHARQVALAGWILAPGEEALPVLARDLWQPGPVGVLHAKAAGVHADVTRD